MSKFLSDKNVCRSVVFLFVVFCWYLILHNADWFLGDDYQFIETTMRGEPSRPWMGQCRFWPLGLRDYSILLLFSKSPSTVLHFIYNAVLLTVSVFVMFKVLCDFAAKSYYIGLFCLLLLMTHSSFLQIHMECIYPERFMFFLLSMFLYFWKNGSEKQSVLYYAMSWICVTYLLFTKEPMFIIFAGISFPNLFFGWKILSEKEKAFNFSILMSVFLFLMLYAFVFVNMYMNSNLFFEHVVEYRPRTEVLRIIFSTDPVSALIFAVACTRAYFVLVKSDLSHLQTDSLLFGAAAYIIAYVIMRLTHSYYTFPAVVLALPSFAHWIARLRREKFYQLLILCGIAAMITSAHASEKKVQSILQNRVADMPFVHDLVSKYKQGKKLYVFANGIPLEKYSMENRESRTWLYRGWVIFLNYGLGRKVFSNDVLIPTENLESLPKNCIVFCPVIVDEKTKNYLKKEYKFVHSVFSMDIYEGN